MSLKWHPVYTTFKVSGVELEPLRKLGSLKLGSSDLPVFVELPSFLRFSHI